MMRKSFSLREKGMRFGKTEAIRDVKKEIHDLLCLTKRKETVSMLQWDMWQNI